MADQSTQSIDIAATPAEVMAVIADFENYPSWASSVRQADVIEPGADGRPSVVEFVLSAGPIRDNYQLRYTWDGDRSVAWTLVKAQMMRAQDGRYDLQASGTGTHVTYWLKVDLAIPMLGQLKRKAERMVMDQALKELKKRVESLTAA